MRLHFSIGWTVSLAAILSLVANSAMAASYYWNTGNGTWSNSAFWSDDPNAGGTTGVVPGILDDATFNQTTVNGAQTVFLDGANGAALSLSFINTGTTLIQADMATTRTLTIGTGGLNISSGAGAVTIGNATNIANISLDTSATFTNNDDSLFSIVNGISSATTGTQSLSFAGNGTGNTSVGGAISNGTATDLDVNIGTTGNGTRYFQRWQHVHRHHHGKRQCHFASGHHHRGYIRVG